MSIIKSAISNRHLSPEDSGFESRLNGEIIPVIRETRQRYNERHGALVAVAPPEGSTSLVYAVDLVDELLRVDATLGPVTLTLPGPSFPKWITVVKTDSSANAVTLSSSLLIAGAATAVLTGQWDWITVAPLGTTYAIVSRNDLASAFLASTTEVLTGTDTAKATTPDAVAALWEKGTDVASAATVTLGEGGFFHITGTTTITDIDFATPKDGRVAYIIFDGALTLTHNATTLALPGNANIITAAGDRACFVQDSSDNVICMWYERKALGPVKEIWSPHTRSAGDTLGDHPAHSTSVSHRTEIYIPNDFISLVSVQLVGASIAGAAAADFTITSDYGTQGEAYDAGAESVVVNQAFPATLIGYLNLAGAMTGVAAGDHVGVLVTHSGGQAVRWLGSLLRYR